METSNSYDSYLHTLCQFFVIMSDKNLHHQMWVENNRYNYQHLFKEISLDFDELYADFQFLLGGLKMLEADWSYWENDKVFFTDSLKTKLKEFAFLYVDFHLNNDIPYHSECQFCSLVLANETWDKIVFCAKEINKELVIFLPSLSMKY